jgi:hypothetical protein
MAEQIGEAAGGLDKTSGYWCISIDGKLHRRCKLVYLYVYGWMPGQIDHKNRKLVDDRPENLHPATPRQNTV